MPPNVMDDDDERKVRGKRRSSKEYIASKVRVMVRVGSKDFQSRKPPRLRLLANISSDTRAEGQNVANFLPFLVAK